MHEWLLMIRAQVNFNLVDRIDAYNQGFVQGNFCTLRDKAEACPLTCSVNRSANIGYPWKSDDPSKRRNKQMISNPKLKLGLLMLFQWGDVLESEQWREFNKKKNKTSLFFLSKTCIAQLYFLDLCWRDPGTSFNPRRSAYEMQSSNLPELKKARPWYKEVNADVLQQALLNLNTGFQNFFEGKTGFPRFETRATFKSFEYKPKTVQIDGRRMRLPSLGWMRFYKSRPIPESWEVRTVTITTEADGWYASVLFLDKSVPDIPLKKPEELKSVTGVDRGIKKIVALANGNTTPNPGIARGLERRLAIRQRRVSRKKKGSNKRAKAGKRVGEASSKDSTHQRRFSVEASQRYRSFC